MNDVLFTPIRLNELEALIKNSVESALRSQPQQRNPTEQPDQLLTVQQAAEFLTLAVPTIYTMVSRGELPVMKRSKRLYFSRVELTGYLKAGRKKSNAEISAAAAAFLSDRKNSANNG